MIIHITANERWHKSRRDGYYRPESLEETGYIRCLKPSQFVEIMEGILGEREELMLVLIDEKRVEAEIKYENFYDSGEKHPHIYGELNLDAVIAVESAPYRV